MDKLIEKTEELLSEIGEIVSDYRDDQQKRDKDGKNFNVFKVLGVQRNKECLHSAFIAELLNPKGAHGMKDAFLNLFKMQTIDSCYNNWNFDTQYAVVHKEYSFEDGRIDILVESQGKGIIIENKIDTCDHDAQLSRYCTFGKDKYGSEKYKLIYLTPEGNEATDKDLDDYIMASYKEDIMPWLTQCLKKCAPASVQETLIQQYQTNLKDILGMMMDEQSTKKLVEKAITKKYIPSTVAIINNKEEIRKQIILNFINKMKNLAAQYHLSVEIDEGVCRLQNDKWIMFSCPKISKQWAFFIGAEKYHKTVSEGGVRYGFSQINGYGHPRLTKDQLALLKPRWKYDNEQDWPFSERKNWPLGWEYLGKSNNKDWWNWKDDWNTLEDMAKGNISRWIEKEIFAKKLHIKCLKEIEAVTMK